MDERTIGKRIRELRKKRGLTQEELACFLCVPKSTISAYENDHIDIKSSAIMEIAKTLHVNPGYFYGDEIKEKQDEIELEQIIFYYRKLSNRMYKKAMLEQTKILVALDKEML